MDGVTIPANKGIYIENGSFLEGIVNTSGNFKKLSGSYIINWLPGSIPPLISFNYVSPGDTNGIIYYLGASKYATSTFINPHTRGEILATASSFLSDRPPQGAFTRSNDGGGSTPTVWHSDQTNTGWLQIEFKNGQSAIVTSFELWASNSHPLSTYMGAGSKLQGSVDGVSWTDIYTFNPNVGSGQRYYSGLFQNINAYSFYRFWSPINNFHVIGDIELYGELLT